MESFTMIYAYISTAVIVPTIQWVKPKIPKDFPIGTDVISGILSLGVVYVLKSFLQPEMDIETMLFFALGLWKTNGTVHALVKTVKKNKKG